MKALGFAAAAAATLMAFAVAGPAQGQASASAASAAGAAARAALPADPWPRVVDLSSAQALVYQPQVDKWDGNQLSFRSAVALKPVGAREESFGVIFATARTQVDRVARTVVFENLQVTKSNFPALPNGGAAYAAELQKEVATQVRTISLDRLQASLAAAGVKPATVPVDNTPPQVITSNSPAILVPIDGAPVLKPVPGRAEAQRVINTRALILQHSATGTYYIHVYDGWLQSSAISGPWTQGFIGPFVKNALDSIAQSLSAAGTVDLLDGGAKANPKPSLANGVPTIYTTQVPTELIVFKGQPDFVPIVGTSLLWASNTTSDVLIDTNSNLYYVLLAGRWFRGPGMTGPWTFVASNALPADFARIPATSLAAAVLPTVAGTPQAQEAVIANSIPQTATVPLVNGPKFTPNFDGAPQYAPIAGTPLSYVVNSSEPIIQTAPDAYYAVTAGVWFTAPALTGPWSVATSVPAVIYTIPTSSPLHYVTYVRIYEATPQVVYVGYTPGYLGTVVEPTGTVVYGTGYVYSPWIGAAWYPPPYTYGLAALPVYNPWVGFTYGFAVGLATAAWTEPYWGGAYYHPGYWGALSLLRLGQRQRLRPLGQHDVFGHAQLVRRRRRRRHHGQRQLLQQPHRHVGHLQRGQAVQRLDRQRDARLRPHREHRRGRLGQRRAGGQLQHLHRPALDRLGGVGHRRRRQHLQPRRRDDRGARGQCARRRRLHVQRQDREHEHLGHGERGQQPLRRRQRQRLQEHRRWLAAARFAAAGRTRRALRPGATGNRRRAAPATADSAVAASARRVRCRA